AAGVAGGSSEGGGSPAVSATLTPCLRALSRSRSQASGSRSTAITAAPNLAHSTAISPSPAPTSQIRSPSRGPSLARTNARTSGGSPDSDGSAQPAGPGWAPATQAGSFGRYSGSMTSTTSGSFHGRVVASPMRLWVTRSSGPPTSSQTISVRGVVGASSLAISAGPTPGATTTATLG